ncbi:mechanosensitive ion channel family protein [Litoribacter populi]|uniref:mechanosensitive ion channel family protein n=1 Tax=Litoribacter populi TaxID=2598460 RepID=UPI001F41CBE8|nr:mechanosensitive ion channel family protein [Litoribacter populi]
MNKLKVFLILIGFLFIQNAKAQDLGSPKSALENFFNHLTGEDFQPKAASKSLAPADFSQEELEEQAIKLKQVFDGAGVIIHLERIPDDPNYVDSTENTVRSIYIVEESLPQLYLEKEQGVWRFSSHSVASINQIHAELYPFGADKLLQVLPKFGTDTYFGLQTWQLISIFLVILLGFAVHKVFTLFFEYIIISSLERLGYENAAKKYVVPVARPLSIFVLLSLFGIFIRVLQLPIEVVHYSLLVLKFLKPLVVTVMFYRLVGVLSAYLEKITAKTENTLDDQLVPLMRKSMKVFVLLVGVLFILKEGLNIDIWPLLTGLSIGGLAFALAAQDTIKNFFGSLMIFVDKPFQVGDWITSGDIDGSVEEVGFRSTRVRSFRNSVYYVPNGKFADSTIDNHGLRQYRRFYTTFTLPLDTPPALIELFVAGLRQIVTEHPKTRKDSFNIYLNDISAYSVNIMFYIFFKVPTWSEELQGRQEILLKVLGLSKSIGIRFAIPSQALQVEKFPGQESLTPNYNDELKTNKDGFKNFFGKDSSGDN